MLKLYDSGVYLVNGREISSRILRNGDVITIGTTKYEFTQA